MMLFQRQINTDSGWEFVGAGKDIPLLLHSHRSVKGESCVV